MLAVSDHANGEDLLREIYGDRAAVVPYVMPGFSLARMASEAKKKMSKADKWFYWIFVAVTWSVIAYVWFFY